MNKTDKNPFLYEADLLLEGDRQVTGTYRMSKGVNIPLPLVLPHPTGVTIHGPGGMRSFSNYIPGIGAHAPS